MWLKTFLSPISSVIGFIWYALEVFQKEYILSYILPDSPLEKEG